MNKYSKCIFAVLVLCVLCGNIVSAYSLRDFGSDIANRILPYVGALFVMIGFPIGVGFAWKYVPGPAKIGMVIAIILVEITVPMALPDGIGSNYRDLWNRIF